MSSSHEPLELAQRVGSVSAYRWLGSSRVTMVAGVSKTLVELLAQATTVGSTEVDEHLRVLTIKPATSVDVHLNRRAAATTNHSQVNATGEGNRPFSYEDGLLAGWFSTAGGVVDIDQFG